MAKLNIPTAQHLARNSLENKFEVRDALLKLKKSPPWFNYNCLQGLMLDLLLHKQPLDEIKKGIEQKEKRPAIRNNLTTIMELSHSHFSKIEHDFVVHVAEQYFPIGKGLLVPFRPSLMYSVGGQLHIPWPIYWKRNPLTKAQKSLFVTLVHEMLQQSPDLSDARVSFLDFSAPQGANDRNLRVYDSLEVELLKQSQLEEMLRIFTDGFILANDSLAADVQGENPAPREEDPRQKSFVL